jgi:hypothetical protein
LRRPNGSAHLDEVCHFNIFKGLYFWDRHIYLIVGIATVLNSNIGKMQMFQLPNKNTVIKLSGASKNGHAGI